MIFLRYLQAVTAAFQEQIKALTDTIFKVQMDTSKALGELTAAVRELQVKTRGGS